jgi:NAD(P)-dependent dehydrogenase (short-subunit alcohol dehydrogenase family)
MEIKTRKVAIVTGGVSGIGAALRELLIKNGWLVVGLDISSSHGEKISEQARDSFTFMQCDVTDYEQLAKAFAATFAKFGRVDAFCCNAGIIDQSSVYIYKYRGKSEIPPKPDTSCTDVCYKALIYGTQLSIHFMRQNPVPGGFIVATSSMVGYHPVASFPEYCGAKSAVNAFVVSAAPVLKSKENIAINAVLPGVVPSQFIGPEMRETFGEDGLTPRETIAAAYLSCLQDPARNGQLIECSRDKHFVLPRPPYADGETSKRTCTVYDPYFVQVHGESSGLEDIVRRRR